MNNTNIVIPTDYIEFLKKRFGSEAESWLESVPTTIANKLNGWNLTLDNGRPLHGAMGLVFSCHKDNRPCILKISWLDSLTETEYKALTIWNGHGAVKLFNYDSLNHIYLMERLTKRTLMDLDIATAGIEAGKLIRTLGVKVNDGFPKLSDRALDIRKNICHNRKHKIIDLDLVKDLLAYQENACDGYLCHGDIGYSNVLQSSDGAWKAIDPKPIIGDLEFSIPELMWMRSDELADSKSIVTHLERIVESGSLNRQKAIGWTIIRAVDYYFWAIDNGLSIDPPKCIRLYQALISEI